MPTINHTITVTIGGVDRTSVLLKDSLFIRTSIGNKGDECSFRLRDADGTLNVIEWQEVSVSVNGTAVFGGYTNRVGKRGVGAGSTKEAWFDIICRDWSSLFDRVVVDRGYTDTADTDVISDLFGTYMIGEGFDAATNVFAVNADVDIWLENITFREALNSLGSVCQAEWHVAPDKSLYWYSQTNPSDAAFNIDVVSPNDSTTFDVLTDTLSINSDATSIVNKIRVIGGEEITSKVTDTFTADGTQTLFGPLTAKPGSMWKITWRDQTNVQIVNFPSFIGYEPEDTLFADGGEYTALVNLESRHVTIKDGNGAGPKALTNVVVEYYALEAVDVTVEDGASQAAYGQVFEQTVYDDTLTSRALAQEYGDRVIAEYAFARENISFSVTEHGLLPGRLITINAPVMGLTTTYNDALALETGVDVLLLENGDRIMLESYGETRKYLIQGVTLRTVVTGLNQFMVIATVNVGKYIPTLIDSLLTIRQFTGASGRLPAKRTIGRLDQMSNNLGDVIAGRAVFTDGGTAPFSWAAYNDHTGIVVGLEDTDPNAYGAMYILNDGSVTTKVGRMDGLGSVGTVSPTGWGIWTENGYFTGAIAATAGEIGGWVIANNLIYADGGTIATRTLPINSSNPGVYLTSSGLFGYGTLGLTFSIPTDPAQRPFFSSGTITNTIYEVTTASILRTGTAGARVQIDNSGVFGYDSGGNSRFSFDTTTGRMTAVNGVFSGSITAGTVSGVLVSGGTVSGAVFTGGTVTQGTVSAAQITGGTVTGAKLTGGTVTGGYVTGGTVNAAIFTGGTVTQGTVSASLVSGGTVTGATVSGGTVTGAYVTGGTISQVGGSVLLGTSGLQFTPPSSYSFGAPNSIKWVQSGTVIGEVSNIWTGTEAQMRIVSGQQALGAGKPGVIYLLQENSLGNPESQLSLDNGVVQISPNDYMVLAGHIRADASSTNRAIGTTNYAFRYLYLKDDNGVDRRISINSSGVLVVT